MHLTRLQRGAESYYLRTVGAEPDDLEGRGDPGGKWLGAGAGALGLDGEALGEPIRAVMAGVHPHTGEVLGRAHSRVRVAAWDLTFAAPKAVSVLWGTADRATAAVIASAHHQSVASAMTHIERHALCARRRAGGVSVSTGVTGAVAAAFPHRFSRAYEPHLHTHVLLANLGEGLDGRWSALDAGRLFAEARAAGLAYNAELRYELGRRLGCRFAGPAGKVPSMVGIPASLVSEMSTRRSDVERRLAEWAADGPRASRHAALATRGPKEARPDLGSLRQRWRDRANRAAQGWEPSLAARRQPADRERGDPPVPPPGELLEKAAGASGFFRRSDVVAALALSVPNGASVSWLARTADVVIEAAATPVPSRRNSRYDVWAAPSAVQAARRVVSACTGRGLEAGGLDLEAGLRAALERRPGLGAGEVAVLAALAKNPAREVVVALDGPVSSSVDMVDGARAMFEAAGADVGVLAPTEAAAETWCTVAGFDDRAAVDRPFRAGSSTNRSVTILAGAEMMSPAQLASVAERRREGDAVVIVAGKWQQQAPVHRLLARAAGEPSRLLRVTERAGPSPIPSGGRSAPSALSVRVEVDGATVVLASTSSALRAELAEDWVSSPAGSRSQQLLVVPDAASADLFNAAIRESLRRAGALGDPTRMGGLELASGDLVRAARPGRALAGLAQVHTVVSCSAQGVLLESPSGDRRTLPRSEVSRRGLHHAYAMTAAQIDRSGRRPTMSLGPAPGLGPAPSRGPDQVVARAAPAGPAMTVAPAVPDERIARRATSDSPMRIRFYAVAGADAGAAVEAAARAREAGSPVPASVSRRLLGRAAEVALPEHLTACIGRPPRTAASLAVWRRAAGSVLAFEQRSEGLARDRERAADSGRDPAGSSAPGRSPGSGRRASLALEKAEMERAVRMAAALDTTDRSRSRGRRPTVDRAAPGLRQRSL